MAPSSEHESAIYFGQVMHARLKPFVHRFRSRVFSLWLDLDNLPRLETTVRGFRVDRWAPVSFCNRDHGLGDGSPVAPWARGIFATHGVATHRVMLFCFPRMWGYCFNPLAIYFAYDEAGRLTGILYQVSNTFGERHSYVLPLSNAAARNDHGVPAHTSAKQFHVSPFFDLNQTYAFRIMTPEERFRLVITQSDEEGDVTLVARHAGRRRMLTSRTLRQALFQFPLMSFKVISAIHWEAVRLMLKGARYHKKPSPPRHAVTRVDALVSSSAT
ncbi:MAG: DUF1365 domain-containing protein [Pseudomonadota bacterium]